MATTPQTTDPRAGWTSASNAQADSLCPGRHLAQRGIPETAGEYAESGRKVHAALAGFNRGDSHGVRGLRESLSLEERETYDACIDVRARLTVQYFGEKPDPNFRQFMEQRYWANFSFNGREYAHSGQADLVLRAGVKAMVIDYKTLPGEVAVSPKNLQLRDLACLVRGTLVPTNEIAVAIIQPHVTREPTLCIYSQDDLVRATKEMFDRVVRSNDLQAKRVAGEVQCKYCRAKGTCVEYQKWAGQITPPAMLSILSVPMQAWTPDQCAIAASALAPCQRFLDELKDMLKVRLEKDPAAIPGWELKPGAVRESIINPQVVFERFAALGGKVEQFMVCVDIAKGRLREAVNGLTGAKGAKLDAAIKTITEGATESKQTAPSLKRVEKEAP